MNMEVIKTRLQESANLKQTLAQDTGFIASIGNVVQMITEAFSNGGKVLICGNGGSASDAIHFCGEMVGRFQKERRAVPAIALNADIATMTAIANDYGYDIVFERGVQAYMNDRDVLIGISTSGNSENVLRAVRAAKALGGKTVGLLGKTGGKIGTEVDCPIIVPHNVTARVQESHIAIIHIICELVEIEID